MKKSYLLISLLLVIALVMVGCGDATSEEPNQAPDTEASTDSKSLDNKDDTNDKLGKRSNPVPLGEWIEFKDTYYESLESFDAIEGTFRLRISQVERGEEVLEKLKSENQFNEPAPEGHEWVIVHMEIEMLEGDEDVPYTVVPFTSIIASTGNEVSQDDWATLDGNEFGYVDLFPGGSHSGRLTAYVPVGDDALFVYEIGFDTGLYFSLNQ
ncbi:MAG: hypothetical protein ACOXZT_08730 [Tissierellaceae bacterium]|jgi:hypothetical protein